MTVIDQFITDQYLYLSDKALAERIGVTKNHVAERRKALNLQKGGGWQPAYYKPELTEGYRDREYEEITPEISIDQQIFALELFAQSRDEGSGLALIARNYIKHLQDLKQFT